MSECRTAREAVLDALVAGAQPPAEVQRHLRACVTCRTEQNDVSQLWRDLGRITVPEPALPAAQEIWQWAQSQSAPGKVPMRKTHLIAALLASLLMGGVAGYAVQPRAQPALPSDGMFLLLLHEAPPSGPRPYTAEQLNAIIGEYRDWANTLRSDGRLISAEKLRDDAGRWLAPEGATAPVVSADVVSGYFVIRARDYEEALTLARHSPHLKYGGTIEVRAIESTTP
ncbi:MAG: YciI family protein [Longimicrobiales bacterium]